MTVTAFDPIAVWHFSSKKINDYFIHSNIEIGSYPIWVFWNLKKALDILYKSQLLIVDKVTFLGAKETVVDFQDNDNIVDEVVDAIVNRINIDKVYPSIKFSGRTILIENGQENSFNDIIYFHCSLNLGSCSVSLMSDCWVPIDRNDKLQIDLAESCSPVLTEALLRIKKLGFDKVDPDQSEESLDELLPQYGFRVYLWDSAINYIDYDTMSSDDKACVNKYLWKNRIDHPG